MNFKQTELTGNSWSNIYFFVWWITRMGVLKGITVPVVSLPLCSFCVFIWNSLVPVKAVIRFWMQLNFLILGEPRLWFSCLFISVCFSFITRLNNLVFILGLLRLQILFKTVGVFDSRAEFIFPTPYCVKWGCGRLEYLYNWCCCRIFPPSFHTKYFSPFVPQWTRWVSEELARISLSRDSCSSLFYNSYWWD